MKIEELEGMNVMEFSFFKLTNTGIGGCYKGTLGPRICVIAYRDGTILKAYENI